MKKLFFILFVPLWFLLLACSEPPDDPTLNSSPADEVNEGLSNPGASIEIASFNIQFLGNFKNKKNEILATILQDYDLVFVQELVAPPFECNFPDGSLCKADEEAAAFFEAMTDKGFSFVLSPEDTGIGRRFTKTQAQQNGGLRFTKRLAFSRLSTYPKGS